MYLLVRCVRKCAKRYSQVCAERRIRLYLEGDAVVKADHSLIARVIDNFFVNALDNTPEGGTIGIRITENALEFYNSGVTFLKIRWTKYGSPIKSRRITQQYKGNWSWSFLQRTVWNYTNFLWRKKQCGRV